MTPDEKYSLDIQGFLKIEGALSPSEVAALNGVIDERRSSVGAWGRGGSLLSWGAPFRALLDHPRVLPYLEELMGEGLRLDHDYAIFSNPGAGGFGLHGGGTPYDPSQYYHVQGERIFCGLTVVSYALADVPPGQGGFACIPGSHKAAFLCPEDLVQFRRESPLVQQIPMRAGDCLLFTEALTHGTFAWTAAHERRNLFFKYSPGHMSWASRYYSSGEGNSDITNLLEDLSPRGRELLRPPSEALRQ